MDQSKELKALQEKVDLLEKQLESREIYSQGCAKRLHNCIMEKKAKEVIIAQQKRKIAKQTYVIENQSKEIEQLKKENGNNEI
jgi:hypothetical protein